MVIMEAMGLRRPVLTTFIAGIPELVKPGENGWLVPAGSVEALVDGLKAVIATPREQLEVMGKNAHSAARVDHSLRKQSETLAELITESCMQNDSPSTEHHSQPASA